ncbi:hypothetical protein ABZ342_15270 [Amycolatopsis sp. NPDC005961]|uniref:hypothetical protein n=1 Tax=Amycolatopsis sp. NPDC005961 TaxID=3156720 RepID=UPI0033C11DF3
MRPELLCDVVLTRALPRRDDDPVDLEYREALALVLDDGRAERVDGWIVRAGEASPSTSGGPELPEVVTPPAATIEASARRGRTVTPAVSYRACSDEYRHRRAIWHSKDLKGVPNGPICALALSDAMGRAPNHDFGKPLEFALTLIAEDAGVGVSTARRAMDQVVRLGFFRRIDYGYGGRGGSKSAIWVPIVPAWFRG